MSQIKYVRIRSLQQRNAINPLPDRAVDGVLLSAESPCLTFETGHRREGHDLVSLYPAFHDGCQCWIEQREWIAGHGYSASGTQSEIIDLAQGIGILVDRGLFRLPKPDGE